MLNLNTGDKITIIGVSWMALTQKLEVQFMRTPETNPKAMIVKRRGKRTEFPINIDDKLIFQGWDIPLKTDSENFGSGNSIMRGNACINLMGTPEAVRGFIEANNMNPLARKSHVVAISGEGDNAKEVPVYPELYDGHAVIDTMLEKLKVG